MTVTAVLKETWKEEKVILRNAISLLEKNMTDYRSERKSEWKSFKAKYKEDMDHLEKSVKKLTAGYKKQK